MSSDEAFGHGLEKSGAPHDEGGDGQSVGPGAPTLRIFALGRARVEKDGLPLDSPDWIQKSRELLYYLLSHPQGRTKVQIGLALWPEASSSQLRSSFHDTLYRLRRALGGKEWIVFRKRRYAFERMLSYSYDVEEFEERGSAIRHYEELVRLLQEQLGASPAPETVVLYESLRSGEQL